MACKLVAYLRVSTSGQGESGLGLEGQQTAIDRHVAATGCTLVATYTEVESGKDSDRPELARAIAHAKRAKATLVVGKLDRLSRNVAFLANLMESKVRFVACDNPNANDLTLHILAAVAQNEAKAISERTKAALAAYKARGGTLGGYREKAAAKLTKEAKAKGSKRAGQSIRQAAIDDLADITPLMLEWRANGDTLATIATKLNEAGHTTRGGSPWTFPMVAKALNRVKPASEVSRS